MGKGERPEHTAPPEIFYNEDEARKYTTNSRMISIQVGCGRFVRGRAQGGASPAWPAGGGGGRGPACEGPAACRAVQPP
jgi:hypothetical protein